MALGTLKIKADSTQAVKSVNALAGSWTEANSKLSLLSKGLAVLGAGVAKFEEIAKAQGAFWSQLGKGGANSLERFKLFRQATGDMIKAQDLLRSQNILMNGDLKITQKQMEAVGKAAIQFSRATGEDATAVLRTLTDAISQGRVRTLARFGMELDTTGTTAQKSARALNALSTRFSDVSIKAEDAGEKLIAYENSMKANLLESAKSVDVLAGKWANLKNTMADNALAFADALAGTALSSGARIEEMQRQLVDTVNNLNSIASERLVEIQTKFASFWATDLKYGRLSLESINKTLEAESEANKAIGKRKKLLEKAILQSRILLQSGKLTTQEERNALNIKKSAELSLRNLIEYQNKLTEATQKTHATLQNINTTFNSLIKKGFEFAKQMANIASLGMFGAGEETKKIAPPKKTTSYSGGSFKMKEEDTYYKQLREAQDKQWADAIRWQEEIDNMYKDEQKKLETQIEYLSTITKLDFKKWEIQRSITTQNYYSLQVKQQEKNLQEALHNGDLQRAKDAQKRIDILKQEALAFKELQSIGKQALGAGAKALWIENSELKKLGKSRSEYLMESLKTLLKAKAVEYTIKSLGSLAEAAALSFWNPAGAEESARAAVLYAAAATAAGGASMTISSGSGSGTNTASGATTPTQQTISGAETKEQQTQIVVNITDSVVGNNPDDVAKSIVKMINNADKRGVLNV